MKKGIYILPSLFTLGNLSAGFLAVLFAFEERFIAAAYAILIAGILDAFDGRIARMTKTTSQFGKELDSLADIVSFGIAPAVMMYMLALYHRPIWGKALCVMFVVCGALRLARFNVNTEKDDGYYFKGLPIPAAAGILAAFVLVYSMFEQDITRKTIPMLMNRMPIFYRMIPLAMILLSYLMVSTVRYSSFKGFKLSRPKTLRQLMMICIAILLIWRYPENMILIIFSVYLLSGLLGFMWRLTILGVRKIKSKDEPTL